MLSISLDDHGKYGLFHMCILAAKRAQELSVDKVSENDTNCKITTLALSQVLKEQKALSDAEQD